MVEKMFSEFLKKKYNNQYHRFLVAPHVGTIFGCGEEMLEDDGKAVVAETRIRLCRFSDAWKEFNIAMEASCEDS